MLLGIAIAVVVLLLFIALLPPKKREKLTEFQQAAVGVVRAESYPTINLRRQQLEEETEVIADEYRRRAEEVWLEEVRGKAAGLFAREPAGASQTSQSDPPDKKAKA